MKLIKNNCITLLTTAIAISLLTSTVHADWGVGLHIDNEAMNYKNEDNDVNLSALFNIQYQGEKFNLNPDAMSYKVFNADKYTVELIAASRNRGFRAKDNATLKGMAERHPSLDLGGRVIIDTGGTIGKIVVDVSKDIHSSKGIDAGIKVGGIPVHAPHWTGEKQMTVAAVGGLRYQSDKVVDYYYGVKNSEATSNRRTYKGKSAVTPFIGLEAQANISPHVTINGDLGLSKVATSIKNSSITDNDDYHVSAKVEFTYWF